MAKKNPPEEPEATAPDPAEDDTTTAAAGDDEGESSEPRITEGGESQTYKMEWAPGVGKANNVCVGSAKYKARADGSFRVSQAHVQDLIRAGLRVVY